MSRIKYQVFVSSTFTDLVDHRQAAMRAISKSGHFAAGMEWFNANDESQFEYIKKVIDDCDYYVLIVGGRYGSIAEDGLSYTEKEFDYAVSKGIDVLAFLPKEPDSIDEEYRDTGSEQVAALERFKKKVQKDRMVDYWSSPDDLALRVIAAVSLTINQKPAKGWVRGDHAIDEKIYSDLEKLRHENQRLEEKLSLATSESLADISSLEPLDSSYSLQGKVMESVAGGFGTIEQHWEQTEKWSHWYLLIAPMILAPRPEGLIEEEENKGENKGTLFI